MTDRKRTQIFLNLLITVVAMSFLSTALMTALPPIIADFEIDAARGQWLTSAYSLAMAIMMPMTAFLITRFSTKRLYVTALGILMAGLIICILAPTFEVMLAGRILQAMSNGITSSMAQVVLLTIYPPERKGSIMGWYGLSIGAAPVIGPTLAGVLVDVASWKMIFIIALGILMVSFICANIVLEDVLETQNIRFDFASFVLSGITFGGITLGIGSLSNGTLSIITWLPLGAGIISGILFVCRQLGLETPFLNVRVFRNRTFTISVISSMALYMIMMSSSMMLPLYIQTVRGFSATVSGLVTLPAALSMAFISPLAGRMYDRFGMRMLAIVGAVGLFIPALGMSFFTMQTPLWAVTGLQIIRCIAIGCLMMPFVTWGVTSLPANDTAHGNALLTALRTIAGAIGIAVFVGIASLASHGGTTVEGLNTSFMCMTVLSGLMLIMEVVFVERKKSETQEKDN